MAVTIFVIVLILIGLSLTGLGIGLLIKKDGGFPEIHIGKNRHMKKKGISCVKSTDREERRSYTPIKVNEKTK
ncbi:MAG: hypothetical protein LIO65_06655 [Odoribacter sp.]|nr:hypothetical protein [Odoribacter sp.]